MNKTMATPRNLTPIAAPVGLLAELTHRCPLGCPYCSNPLAMDSAASELDTASWKDIFSQAAAAGILHVHLSGGEPASRRDLAELVAHCTEAGLYTNLITSGVGINAALMAKLDAAGLDHFQLSIQDSVPDSADRIAGYAGAFAKKHEVAALVLAAGIPLTVNAVMHRANITRAADMVQLAIRLGARRVEIAHTQYYGWAKVNRDALMPTRAQAEAAIAEIEALKADLAGVIVIDHVLPDYYARTPKACMGGWAKRTLNITPTGKALPCHAAESIPGLEFWTMRDHSLLDIWHHSPAFNAYRGTDWMRAPCLSCARKEIDFGGCRCQALALTGDARAADPDCHLSAHHDKVVQVLTESTRSDMPYLYRRLEKKPAATD